MIYETEVQRYDRKTIQIVVLLAEKHGCDLISCDVATREFVVDCPEGVEYSFALELRERLSELSQGS